MTVVTLQEEIETCGERGWTGGLLVSYLPLLSFLISHVRVLLSSVLHFLLPSAGPFHNHPSVTCQATSMRVIVLSGFLVRQLLSVSVCLFCLCLFVCVISHTPGMQQHAVVLSGFLFHLLRSVCPVPVYVCLSVSVSVCLSVLCHTRVYTCIYVFVYNIYVRACE